VTEGTLRHQNRSCVQVSQKETEKPPDTIQMPTHSARPWLAYWSHIGTAAVAAAASPKHQTPPRPQCADTVQLCWHLWDRKCSLPPHIEKKTNLQPSHIICSAVHALCTHLATATHHTAHMHVCHMTSGLIMAGKKKGDGAMGAE
jgi:hypothetical protein